MKPDMSPPPPWPEDDLTKQVRRWCPFETTENICVTFRRHEKRCQGSHALGLVVVKHAIMFIVSLVLPSLTVKLP